jgi:hypothetical protein
MFEATHLLWAVQSVKLGLCPAVWTKAAVSHLALAKSHSDQIPAALLTLAQQSRMQMRRSLILQLISGDAFQAFMRSCDDKVCSKGDRVSTLKRI